MQTENTIIALSVGVEDFCSNKETSNNANPHVTWKLLSIKRYGNNKTCVFTPPLMIIMQIHNSV